MASILTENSVIGDQLIFEDIVSKAYRNISGRDPMSLLKAMVSDGVIQIDALFEKAISVTGNIKRDSTIGKDFVDGSDAKKVTVQWRIEYPNSNNRIVNTSVRRVATITNLKHKRGFLRCVVAETLTKQVYYFKIPYLEYKGLKTVNIYFNQDGSPKENGNFWHCKCNSFKEMCK
jgi:hypothetical protein